jgi:hypothetical protein
MKDVKNKEDPRMTLLRICGFTIIILMTLRVASAQTPNRAPDDDAVKDFSTQSNPNGVWSYGYLTSWGAPFTPYPWAGTCDYPPGISYWTAHNNCGDEHAPLVGHNDTAQPICFLTLCVPPNYLWLNVLSQLSALRWMAPSSGRFLMQVTFVGLEYGVSPSTDVYVLRKTRLFLKAPMTSYQWPLLLNPDSWTLSAGDTVDFIVDWGQDKDFNGDSTGVEVKVWNLGPH